MATELEMIHGPSIGRRWALQGFELTIGRDPACDLVIAEREISRVHAKLTLHDGVWCAQDMGSSNGTRVNGATIGTTPVALNLGDVIQLGPAALRFQDSAMAGQAAPGFPAASSGPRETSRFRETAGAPRGAASSVFDADRPWGMIALAALACIAVLCLAAFALTVLPYLLLVGGLVCGCIGVSLYRRFHGHTGWQQQASKGLAMAVGGFGAAALGLLLLTWGLWSLAGPGGFQPAGPPPAQAPSTAPRTSQPVADDGPRSSRASGSPLDDRSEPAPAATAPIRKGSPASRPIGEFVNRN